MAVMLPVSLEGEAIIAKQHISYCLFLLPVGRRTWLALFEESYPFSLSLNTLSYALLFFLSLSLHTSTFSVFLAILLFFSAFSPFFSPKDSGTGQNKARDTRQKQEHDIGSSESPESHVA